MKPRKPIARVSASMKRKLAVYFKLRKEFLMVNERCAVFPWKKAEDVHHTRGRAGGLLCDTRYWLAVSRDGHEKIGREPEWARRNGYLCALGQWGKQE